MYSVWLLKLFWCKQFCSKMFISSYLNSCISSRDRWDNRKKKSPDSNDWRKCHHSTVFNYCAHIAWLIDNVLAETKKKNSVSTGAERKQDILEILYWYAKFTNCWGRGSQDEGSCFLFSFFSMGFSSMGRVCLYIMCDFSPLIPFKRGWRKGTRTLSEAYQHRFSTTLIYPLCYLSFPFQFHIGHKSYTWA